MMMIQTHYCIAQHFFDTSMRLQIAAMIIHVFQDY